MGEFAIRRNRGFTVPQYQSVGKAEKQSGGASAQPVSRATVTLSETLRQLMTQVSLAENQIRESRRTLQTGEAVLDEVQNSLDRIGQLIQEAAGGEEPDREALQAELEKLCAGIERMLGGAAAGGAPLFLDGEADLADWTEVLRLLLEKMGEGLPPDQALSLLLADSALFPSGSALLSLLSGIEGAELELLLGLLNTLQSSGTAPEAAPGVGQEQSAAGNASDRSMEVLNAAEGTEPEGRPEPVSETAADRGTTAPRPASVLRFGQVQAAGRDLSGVSFRSSTGELTIGGQADVTVRGNGQEAPSLRITGSGTVILYQVNAPRLTVDTDAARVFSAGENSLGEVLLEEGARLTLGGGGLLRLGALRGNETNALYLANGAAVVEGSGREAPGTVPVPVILEGPASLMAQASQVSDAGGKPLEPFDMIWKALLPGWSGVTYLEVDGRQTRTALLRGDPARLWLTRGDQGYPAHTLVLQGQDEAGRPRTRYAYLYWNQRKKAFEEISMYPNPFSVTGGEPGVDWIYEEETHTLHILSAQVTAVSGGPGLDANREPFSGRIALADGIGPISLTLEGVVCQVSSGRAFDLGRENDVTLILQSGTDNLFESGAGCADISLGDGTRLSVDYAASPAGTLSGTIGTDAEPAKPQAEAVLSLQMGGGAVILPQFRLSARALRLDRMSVRTPESAREAATVIDEDRRRIAQIQAVYSALYHQLGQNLGGLLSAISVTEGLVRDTDSASALLEDMRRSILLQPSQALRTHGRRGAEDVRQLFQ